MSSLFSLLLIGCNRQDKDVSESDSDYDNTETNVRDRDSATKTPLDQSNNAADRTITQKIRQAIMSDDSLSVDAKNIKIVTVNGVVTLRGPVSSSREKNDIASKVNDIPGVRNVDNQLDVTRSNY